MNLSINETMSRTVMTSVTTLLALISLFILGGDVIRGFVFAMIWGVVVGTYSSIFIASQSFFGLVLKGIGVNQMPRQVRRCRNNTENLITSMLLQDGMVWILFAALIAGLVRGFSGFAQQWCFFQSLVNI